MPSTTAVRIMTISAAQNKRGKDCFEGGMDTGSFTWFKDMGGNSNWMYLKVVNVSSQHVSLALWLLYEASTEPLVDPLTGSGSIQVGFFNQSKNLNRQVPLFELADESKPGLEIGAGQSSTLKVRINDLSSHHQNQRFIIVIGPADAPIRGSRSVPIEIMSKPRVDSDNTSIVMPTISAVDTGAPNLLLQQSRYGNPAVLSAHHPATSSSSNVASNKRILSSDASVMMPVAKRQQLTDASIVSTLAGLTDPQPTRRRKLDLILTLLSGLQRDEIEELHSRIKTTLLDASSQVSLSNSSNGDGTGLLQVNENNAVAPPPMRLQQTNQLGASGTHAGNHHHHRGNLNALALGQRKPTTPSAAAAAEAEAKKARKKDNIPEQKSILVPTESTRPDAPIDDPGRRRPPPEILPSENDDVAPLPPRDENAIEDDTRDFSRKTPLVKTMLDFQETKDDTSPPEPPSWVANVSLIHFFLKHKISLHRFCEKSFRTTSPLISRRHSSRTSSSTSPSARRTSSSTRTTTTQTP